MIDLGELYFIPQLRPLCVEKYGAKLRSLSTPVEFIRSIPDIYASTPKPVRELRDEIGHYIREQVSVSILHEEKARVAFNHATLNAPEFGKDLLDLYIKTPLHATCFRCECFQDFKITEGRCQVCRELNCFD